MYKQGLGFELLSSFIDHDGFDGMIIGKPDCSYHLEFTQHKYTKVGQAKNTEQLLVFYLPKKDEWLARCKLMTVAGFKEVSSFNPYWDRFGKAFEDIDCYRVVIENDRWDK